MKMRKIRDNFITTRFEFIFNKLSLNSSLAIIYFFLIEIKKAKFSQSLSCHFYIVYFYIFSLFIVLLLRLSIINLSKSMISI